MTYLHIVHDHVLDRVVLEVLSQTADGHTVATSAGSVLDENVGRSGLDRDAVITP